MRKDNPHRNSFLAGKIKNLAGKYRQEPTPAEALLWNVLRGRQVSGAKFRRQHPIGHYIVDFCCPKAKLVIEVDGEVHKQQVEADKEREQIILELGYQVLRFTNAEVLNETDQVLQKIKEAL